MPLLVQCFVSFVLLFICGLQAFHRDFNPISIIYPLFPLLPPPRLHRRRRLLPQYLHPKPPQLILPSIPVMAAKRCHPIHVSNPQPIQRRLQVPRLRKHKVIQPIRHHNPFVHQPRILCHIRRPDIRRIRRRREHAIVIELVRRIHKHLIREHPAHRQPRERAAARLAAHVVVLLDPGEEILIKVLAHVLRRRNGDAGVGRLVAVHEFPARRIEVVKRRRHHHRRRDVSQADEVVHDVAHAPEVLPVGTVAAGAVREVQQRVLLVEDAAVLGGEIEAEVVDVGRRVEGARGGVVDRFDGAAVAGGVWGVEGVVEVGVEFWGGLELGVKGDLEARGDLVALDIHEGGKVGVDNEVASVDAAVGGVVAVDEVGEAVDAAGEGRRVCPHAVVGGIHLVGPFVGGLGGELRGRVAHVKVAGLVVVGVVAAVETGRCAGGVKLVGEGLDAAANDDALGRGIDVSEVDFIAGRGSARLSNGHGGRCFECHEGTPEGEGRKDNHHRNRYEPGEDEI